MIFVIIFLILIYGISLVWGVIALTRKYHTTHCSQCHNDAAPVKKFNWWAYIFSLGLIYVIIYTFKKPRCPICGNESVELKADNKIQKRAIAIFSILILIGLISAYIVYRHVFFMPHRNLATEKPDYVLTAPELLSQFTANEDSTYKLYGNKALQVSGKIADITKKGESDITLVLDDPNTGISCSFDSAYLSNNLPVIKAYKVGDPVTVKGQCDGYDPIMGVVLTRCVLVEENK